MPTLNDKIWFTYKARVQAHIRLERMNSNSQLLLVWYALLTAILAIASIRYPKILGGNTDIYAAILSIALLVVSLAVTSRDFRGRSIAMRENYLSLQHLHDSILQKANSSPADLDSYHGLLRSVENHTAMDDKIFRVKNRASLSSRKPAKDEIIAAYSYRTLKAIVVIALYIAPTVLVFLR